MLPAIPAAPPLEPVAADLSLAGRFDLSNSEYEDTGNVAANFDPFDQVEITDDHYLDASGVEIAFSAGIFPAADVSLHNWLNQQMDNLHQYNHSILGEEGILQIDVADESSGTGDPTITDIVAQLQALGKTMLPVHRN